MMYKKKIEPNISGMYPVCMGNIKRIKSYFNKEVTPTHHIWRG